MITAKPFKRKQLRAKRGPKVTLYPPQERNWDVASESLSDEPDTTSEVEEPEVETSSKLKTISREQFDKIVCYVVTNTGGIKRLAIDHLIKQFSDMYGYYYGYQLRDNLSNTLARLVKEERIERVMIKGVHYYYNLLPYKERKEEKDAKETNSASLNG